MTTEEIIERFDREFPRGLCQVYPGNEGNIYAFGQEVLVKSFILSIIQEDRKTRDAELRERIEGMYRDTDGGPLEDWPEDLAYNQALDEILILLPQPQEETM